MRKILKFSSCLKNGFFAIHKKPTVIASEAKQSSKINFFTSWRLETSHTQCVFDPKCRAKEDQQAYLICWFNWIASPPARNDALIFDEFIEHLIRKLCFRRLMLA